MTTATAVATEAGLEQEQALTAVLKALKPAPDVVLSALQGYLDEVLIRNLEAGEAGWVSNWLERRDEWLRKAGKLLAATSVAEISPTMKSPAAIHKARGEGRLIAFEIAGRFFFPAFQFGKDGAPESWVREVATALPDPDSQLQFLVAGRRGHNGRSFAELLNENTPSIVPEMVREAHAIANAEAR